MSWAGTIRALSHEDRLLTFAEDGSTLDAVLDECDRYRHALEDLAGDYGCTVVAPPDVSLPPNGEPCRYRNPDDSTEWCYACIASAALDGGDV
jgi:hypothetical protein